MSVPTHVARALHGACPCGAVACGAGPIRRSWRMVAIIISASRSGMREASTQGDYRIRTEFPQ